MSEYAGIAYLQLTRRTWEILLPHLEEAVKDTTGETYEVQTEVANVRNMAYCRTEGRDDKDDNAKTTEEDWLG